MKVRYKFFATLLAGMVIAGIGIHLASSGTLVNSFSQQDEARAKSELERVEAVFGQIVGKVHAQTGALAELAPEKTLTPDRVTKLDLDGALLLKQTGESDLWIGRGSLSQTAAENLIKSNHLVELAETKPSGLSGLVRTPAGAFIASFHKTADSRWLASFKEVDDSIKSQLSRVVSLNLQWSPVLPAGSQNRFDSTQSVWVEGSSLMGTALLRDLKGQPLLRVEAAMPRSIHQLGQETTNWMTLQIVCVGAIFIMVVSYATMRHVIGPLEDLGNQVSTIGAGSSGKRVVVQEDDEVASLAFNINQMLDRLDDGSRRLQESQDALKRHNENLELIIAARTKEIEYQAYHDKLTGLPNRALFLDRLSQALRRCFRTKRTISVLFIDLDNFKLVNDSLGHDMGDALLMQVAERLSDAVRPGDTVARLGGDEFTILLEDVLGEEEPRQVAKRILDSLKEPFMLGSTEAFANASIGIAIKTNPYESAESLLKSADTAMYHAKGLGRSRYVFFSPQMHEMAKERLEMETALRKAVIEGDITAAYQPLIELKSGRIVGCEALARWHHTEKGSIPPSVFIPIAEETGLIVPLGWKLLEEACYQAMILRDILKSPDFIMSVNLSGRQFQSGSLVTVIRQTLEKTMLPPQCLKLEITESILMENREESIDRMKELKALGVYLALDDFGTGYSSLSTLHAFPIDTLKIDKSFISRLEEEEGAQAIVEAILAMAHTLKIDVTGEGVESEAQADLIRRLGCQLGQGFLFDRPLTGEGLSDRLKDGTYPQAEEERRAA
jgi:diguanylate cyclase (GGDEF)-like protein